MNIKIGDRVKFLNDVGGGKVIRFIDKDTVAVLNEDEFEIPTLISELLLIGQDEQISGNYRERDKKRDSKMEPLPDQKPFSAPKAEQIKEDTFVNPSDDLNIFLAVVPTDIDINKAKFDFYIINDSNYNAYYNFVVKHAPNIFESRKQQLLEANTKEFIATFTRDTLNEINEFFVQMFFFQNRVYAIQPVVNKEIKVSPLKLFKEGSFKENDFFDENALLFTIISPELKEEDFKFSAKEIEIALQEKTVSPVIIKSKLAKEKSELQNSEEVIDLHIHELVETEAGLEPKGKLEIQMKEFHSKMEEAIQLKKKKIIFIHGVGNGVLKNDIRKAVEKKYRFEYQDASFAEYGYGATLVFIPQNKK